MFGRHHHMSNCIKGPVLGRLRSTAHEKHHTVLQSPSFSSLGEAMAGLLVILAGDRILSSESFCFFHWPSLGRANCSIHTSTSLRVGDRFSISLLYSLLLVFSDSQCLAEVTSHYLWALLNFWISGIVSLAKSFLSSYPQRRFLHRALSLLGEL